MNLLEEIPQIVTICSDPKAGKTNLLKYILFSLFKNKQIQYGLTFCSSSFTRCYDFLPKAYIYNTYDEQAIVNLMNIQIKQIQDNKDSIKEAFIIFDDMIGEIDFHNNKLFKKLISSYRHYHITIFFSIQYFYAVPPLFRQCCSIFITFYNDCEDSIKAIRKIYMGEKNG